MQQLHRRNVARASACLLPILIFGAISFAHQPEPQRRVMVADASVTSPRKPLPEKPHRPINRAALNAQLTAAHNRKVWLDTRLVLDTIKWNDAKDRPPPTFTPNVSIGTAASTYVPPHPPFPISLTEVQNCIKGAESGNYAESTHPGSGSGAYQFVPGTWRYYFGRWRAEWNAAHPKPKDQVGYYAYAYQAPAWIQDAVLAYTLTHGGAHNWDPKWGPDYCTVNLP